MRSAVAGIGPRVLLRSVDTSPRRRNGESIKIKVNGLTHGVTASLDTPLLYVLHNELHLHGPRFGCGLAQCGACSVLLDGKEIRSCVTPVAAVSGKAITTLEGLPALYAASRGTTAAAPASASVAAGVDRCAGAALRLLPERDDDPGRRPAGDDEEPDRGPDPHGDERASVPLRDVSENPDRDPEGRGRDGEGREVAMTGLLHEKEFSRKTFVKGGGALIVGFSALGAGTASAANGNTPFAPARRRSDFLPDLTQVDSWIAITPDNTVHRHPRRDRARPRHPDRHPDARRRRARTWTWTQMVYAHARDVAERHGRRRRLAAASRAARRRSARRRRYAKQTLLNMASTQLGVPVASLTVSNGVDLRRRQDRQVRRPDRRQAVQLRTLATATHVDDAARLIPGQGIAKPVSRVQARRQVVPADRHPGEGDRHVHVHPERPRPGDAARPRRPAARAGANTSQNHYPLSVDASSISTSRALRSCRSTTSSPSSRRRSTTRSRPRRS